MATYQSEEFGSDAEPFGVVGLTPRSTEDISLETTTQNLNTSVELFVPTRESLIEINKALENEVYIINQKLARLHKEKDTVQTGAAAEISSRDTKIQQMEFNMEEMKDCIDDVKKEVEVKESQLRQKNIEITKLTDTLDAAKNMIIKLQEKVEKFETESSNRKEKEDSALREEVEVLKKNIRKLEKELQGANQVIMELKEREKRIERTFKDELRAQEKRLENFFTEATCNMKEEFNELKTVIKALMKTPSNELQLTFEEGIQGSALAPNYGTQNRGIHFSGITQGGNHRGNNRSNRRGHGGGRGNTRGGGRTTIR